MSEKRYQIMSMVSNPDDFLSWSRADKISFYNRAVKWHDYIERLQKQKLVSDAWGTEKIPGMATKVATKTLLIAIYNATFEEFSELITQDPLWNYGIYHAPALKSIEGDYEDDLARNKRIRARLETQLGKKLPEPAVKFLDADQIPDIKPGGKMRVMVTFSNIPGYGNLPDEEKLAIDERVLQMHEYHSILRERGIIVSEWGCYQNWGFSMSPFSIAQSGRHVYQVNSYDEFDALYLMDPQTLVSEVRTIMLVPFGESRIRSKRDLKNARTDLKK